MCRLILAFALLLLTLPSWSLERFWQAEIMVKSRHDWRGEVMGTSMAIEPSVTATAGRFSFNVWAALTPDNSYTEVDLIPSYQFNYFTFTILDYYNPVQGEKNQYLNFKEGANRHSVEATIDNYAVEKQKLKYLLATFFLGDKNPDTGKPYYSTYVELSYPFTILGIDAEPFVGITPFRGYYAEKLNVVNTGISFGKELDFKWPFTIPLSLSLVSNPSTKNSFVTFAAGIAF